ncbi:MAG: hypothetical protein N4A49_01750 [Marinifilaceae bacterium]|jgi:hypothetical protein|nr:hypothetical protein [Marinifilaceae bacterium]
MKIVILEEGQNLNDIAIQETGSHESVFEIALENNFDLGHDPPVGTPIKIPRIQKPEIVNYYKERNIKVVSE